MRSPPTLPPPQNLECAPIVGMIANFDISQETFSIDILTALKSYLKHGGTQYIVSFYCFVFIICFKISMYFQITFYRVFEKECPTCE